MEGTPLYDSFELNRGKRFAMGIVSLPGVADEDFPKRVPVLEGGDYDACCLAESPGTSISVCCGE
jgi:hypothetical protein